MSGYRFLPYNRQLIDEADVQAIVDVLKSDYLTTGPLVERFEHGLGAYTGATYVVAVNSGTAALHAAYFAAGLRPGDEIVTSPLTFVATANAAIYLGASIRFVDVDPDTGNIDPRLIEPAINKKTKLIVPVDFAGHPADYDEIRDLARKYSLVIVADAAHSLGATYHGRKVGTLADITATSFHPVKSITTGEGGAVFTNRKEWAHKARLFRSHGIVRSPDDMVRKVEGPWYYEVQQIGFNYRITDIQCALGLSQLQKLDAFISRRREIAARYQEAFQDLPGIQLPVVREYVEPGWHLYILRVEDPKLRGPLFQRLRELGLGVQVHYIPVYYHPFYQQLGYRIGLCPNAEAFYSRAISIPLYPKMSDEDVEFVIDRVRKAVRMVC